MLKKIEGSDPNLPDQVGRPALGFKGWLSDNKKIANIELITGSKKSPAFCFDIEYGGVIVTGFEEIVGAMLTEAKGKGECHSVHHFVHARSLSDIRALISDNGEFVLSMTLESGLRLDLMLPKLKLTELQAACRKFEAKATKFSNVH